MTHSSSDGVLRVREELAKVSSLVLTARRLLASGALVDLAAVEGRVRAVCSSIETMSREDGQILFPDVESLAKKLDSLEGDLREHVERTRSPAPVS
jgi:hypothetical protein